MMDRILGPPVRLLTPQGWRIAWATVVSGGQCVVVDGQPGKIYERIAPESLVFSPDGKRFGYAAKGGRSFVIVDGQESRPYNGLLCEPAFRRDGVVEFLAADFGDRGGVSRVRVSPTSDNGSRRLPDRKIILFSPEGAK